MTTDLAAPLAAPGAAPRAHGFAGDRGAIALLVSLWGLFIALIGIGGDFPLNDDWAYAWSAKNLVATGSVRILEWAAPSLVSHIAWGALLLRLFGDDHRVLRCGTLAFGLACVLLVYALARRAGHPPRQAALAALALECSPWFVNLSFTYMTDVPWLAFLLGSLYAALRALRDERPRYRLLVLSGTLLGIAALTRQFAVIVAPAFLLALYLDERARRPSALSWQRLLLRSLCFGAPLILLYGAFHLWYTRIHGVTQANRDALRELLGVDLWQMRSYIGATLHYLGLWLFPLALVALGTRRLRPVIGPLKTPLAAALLIGFALLAQARFHAGACTQFMQPYMPYLANIFYVFGLGPPTITDSYTGRVPAVHSAPWINWSLTAASTLGGLWAIGTLSVAAGRTWCSLFGAASSDGSSGEGERDRSNLRALALGSLALYLSWHWLNDGYLFDRYLLPALPLLLLLALDAIPGSITGSRWAAALYLISALWSISGTREYLSWNGARLQAVSDLAAAGVPDDQVDGGFEINGPRHFQRWFQRTRTLMSPNLGFWVHGARFRVALQPEGMGRDRPCTVYRSYPYWSWPGAGEQRLYVLQCNQP